MEGVKTVALQYNSVSRLQLTKLWAEACSTPTVSISPQVLGTSRHNHAVNARRTHGGVYKPVRTLRHADTFQNIGDP